MQFTRDEDDNLVISCDDDRERAELIELALGGGRSDVLAHLEEAMRQDEAGLAFVAGADYEEIGALTCAPIIATDYTPHGSPAFLPSSAAWWFPNYATEDEIATLLLTGSVTSTKVEEA